MDAFWIFARALLRHRALVIAGVFFAAVSAAGLTAGVVAALPVLETILEGQRKGLPEIVGELNDARLYGLIPDTWIHMLPPGPFTAVVIIMSALAVLTVIGATANFFHAFCAMSAVHQTVARVRREAFGRVVAMPLQKAVKRGAGDTVSRIVNDANQLAQGLGALLSKSVAQIFKGAAGALAALVIDWRIALAAVVLAPILATVLRKIGKRVRRASRGALQAQAGLYSAANEALRGLRVVKVHNAERLERGRFQAINRAALQETLRVRTMRALSAPLVEALAIIILGGLIVLCAKLILDGYLDPSRFIGVFLALGLSAGSLRPLAGLINDIQQAGPAAERLQEILDTEPEPGRERGLPSLPRHARSIVFEAVTFTYEGQPEPAVSGVHLEIPHGETVAFVGPNGSGKTTLLGLVPRLFDPTKGRVLIDGADIRKASVRSLRRQIGVVTQETVLFPGTIAENIAYGATSASREQIIAAAKRARAEGFIKQLDGGYDAIVGEQGLTLSGGQRQRIAIARAILRDPAILILDEATSMIDAESEARIGEAIAEFSEDRTALIVAHRLSTVLSADRIVVMDSGRVVDQGRHEDLLTRCATYAAIAAHQLVPAAS